MLAVSPAFLCLKTQRVQSCALRKLGFDFRRHVPSTLEAYGISFRLHRLSAIMSQLQYVPLGDYNFGYTAPIPLAWNPTVYCLVAAFSAVPMWMTIELTFQIYATFQKYSGLYFWSLLFCTWCITLRQIGRICIYFVPGCNQVFSLVFVRITFNPC